MAQEEMKALSELPEEENASTCEPDASSEAETDATETFETAEESEDALEAMEEAPADGESVDGGDAVAVEDEENPLNAVDAPVKAVGFLITKKMAIIASIVAVALMVGAFLGGYFLFRGKDDPMGIDPDVHQMGNTPIDQVNPDPSSIMIPGFSRVVFPADDKMVGIYLTNPEGNPCYFRYTLRLPETGEVLYTGKLIPPGMYVDEILLERSLPRGSYKLEILIETFSLDESRTPMNGATATVELYCD